MSRKASKFDRVERIGDALHLCVSEEHGFGTDTILLAEFAHPKRKDQVWDLGTGCGMIPLWLMHKFSPAHVVGVDVQKRAIAQFSQSIYLSGMEGRMEARLLDICSIPKEVGAGMADVVVCNPPYKALGSGIVSGRSAKQIARHEMAATLQDSCKAAGHLLRFGGRFCLCQRPERLPEVMAAMKGSGMEPKRLRMVQKNGESPPWLFLLEGRRGGSPFLQVEAPLLLYQMDGTRSEEMTSIYGSGGQENGG